MIGWSHQCVLWLVEFGLIYLFSCLVDLSWCVCWFVGLSWISECVGWLVELTYGFCWFCGLSWMCLWVGWPNLSVFVDWLALVGLPECVYWLLRKTLVRLLTGLSDLSASPTDKLLRTVDSSAAHGRQLCVRLRPADGRGEGSQEPHASVPMLPPHLSKLPFR